jgi:RNA methyltransferase, TrmH family
MHRVASRRNPIVARYRAAASGEPPGTLLLDGIHLVADALAAGVPLRHAAIAAAARDDPAVGDLAGRLSALGVELVEASPMAMRAISPVRSPSAVVALADRPDPANPGRGPALLIVAADVQAPGNLGAIVRVAEAGGASGVVAAGASADPFGWKALRGSMGSALRLPIERTPRVADAIGLARGLGCRLVAAVPRGGRPFFELDFRAPTAVLIGGEGAGLAAPLVEAADDRVSIPMTPPVESLNAAVAAALIVYEARRQRGRT